jgi:hypothetical protein
MIKIMQLMPPEGIGPGFELNFVLLKKSTFCGVEDNGTDASNPVLQVGSEVV